MTTGADHILNVPFRSQSWDIDQWQQLGFMSRDDAKYWERSSCGVLCLGMAAEYFGVKRTTKQLIDKGVALDGYRDDVGWSHGGLVTLAQSIGLKAEVGRCSPETLRQAIDRNQIPIVSVKSGFRTTRTLREWLRFWKRTGGHLITVMGYRCDGDQLAGFYVHHTSVFGKDWKKYFVPLTTFRAASTGRGIFVSKSS